VTNIDNVYNDMVINSELDNEVLGDPIFICGYPKSGTTLLASLLDGHSECLVVPEETKFFKKVILQNHEDRFDYLFFHTNISVLRKDIVDEPSGIRDYTKIDFSILYELSKKYWRQSEKSNIDLLESLVYGFANATKNVSYKYWVEKTPLNENYLDVIQQYWKKSKAILIIRDPRQTFCSHREYQHKKKQPSKIMIANFVARWKEGIRSFVHFLKNGGTGIIIRYEELVNDTEAVMKKVAHFIGVSYENNLLYPTRAGTSWSGNSAFNENDFNKVTPRSENYLDNLTKNEIQYIEYHLSELMHQNGYAPNFNKPSMLSVHAIYYDLHPKFNKIKRLIFVRLPQFLKKIFI